MSTGATTPASGSRATKRYRGDNDSKNLSTLAPESDWGTKHFHGKKSAHDSTHARTKLGGTTRAKERCDKPCAVPVLTYKGYIAMSPCVQLSAARSAGLCELGFGSCSLASSSIQPVLCLFRLCSSSESSSGDIRLVLAGRGRRTRVDGPTG